MSYDTGTELCVVMADERLNELIESLIAEDSPIVFQYDTTFSIGGWCISVCCFSKVCLQDFTVPHC
jgi:hypothetical protein